MMKRKMNKLKESELNLINKRLFVVLIIFVMCLTFIAFPYLDIAFSENIQLPSGWSFSSDYQKIPVSLKGTAYYAYQIEKKGNNENTIGWLIVDSNNNIISDSTTYKNLALAATVSKYTVKLNELKYMEDLDKNLKDIKWRIDLYEKAMPLLKSLSSFIGSIKGDIPSGLIEEGTGMIVSVPQSQVISISDAYLEDFTTWVGNNIIDLLVNTGELASDLSDASALKVFGVIKVVIRKGAYVSFKKGFDQLEQALNILNSHNGAWSYEDASNFLTNYEQGEARSIAYGSWYLDLIPSSKWDGLWDNVFKQVLPEWVANPADFGVKFRDWLPKAIKTNNPDVFGYNKVIEDITSIESSFMLYKSFYDTSIKDSMANKTYSAIISSLSGFLSITSNPSGAKVYINGTYKGVTPIKIELKKGSYTVKLSKEGYNDYTKTATVSVGKTTSITISLGKTVSLVGKWRMIYIIYANKIDYGFYDHLTLEFLKDGTVIVSYYKSTSFAGSYKIIENNRVIFSGDYWMGGRNVANFSISNNQLWLDYGNGNVEVYSKTD